MQAEVHKYGGTSLGTIDAIKNAAEFIANTFQRNSNIVVVVSARGDTTNSLLALTRDLGAVEPTRETDQLLATGEIASAAQFAIALQSAGVPAVSMSGRQAHVQAEGPFGGARISAVDSTELREQLAVGHVPVVSGFQGVDAFGDTRTLGRGASDTTAVAISAALSAPECHIHTDVDGVYTADPRVVDEAVLLSDVDTEFMLEMSLSGARVVHARAAALALTRNIAIRVSNSFDEGMGTLVFKRAKGAALEHHSRVRAITHDSTVVEISVAVPRSDNNFEIELLRIFAARDINIELNATIVKEDHQMVMFSAPEGELSSIRSVIHEIRPADIDLHINECVGKVSVIGAGLANSPGEAARIRRSLSNAGIQMHSISHSFFRASVIVPRGQLLDAVRELHDEFIELPGFTVGAPAALERRNVG